MKHQSVLLPGRLLSLLLCALFILAAASAVNAQSGRKIPKRTETPAPQPPASSEPPVAPPAEQNSNSNAAIPVRVVTYQQNINTSNIYTNVVIEGFRARMGDVKGVKVQAGGEMNRKQASDTAKASADTYVVWIELLVDVVDAESARSSYGYVDPYYLYVDYVVFTPGTGKQKASGHVYQRRGTVSGVPLPGNLPRTPGTAEYTLKKAGEETAERVLDAIDALAPPVIRH